MASPNRSYHRQEGNGTLVFVAGAQAVQHCPVCFDTTGSLVGVSEVQVSRANKRRYQKCISATEAHVLFLGKDVVPLSLQAGLSMPVPPPILDRGVVQGGKVRCAAPDCPRSRGHRACATKRCARCCAQAAVAEREAGRDGSLLCSAHKSQILQAIALLNLPPPELLTGPNQLFASQGSSTTGSLSLPPVKTSDPSTSGSNPETNVHRPLADATPEASGSNSHMDGIPAVRVGGLEKVQSILEAPPIPRQVPRAMPVDLKFVQAAPSERSRIERAVERTRREDNVDIRLSFWHNEKQINFSTKSNPFTFRVEDHDEVDFIITKYGGTIVERYDPHVEEWVIQSTKKPWDITGQRHLLLRVEGLTDADCPGLSEELAQVLSHPLFFGRKSNASHTPAKVPSKPSPMSNLSIYYTPPSFPFGTPGPNSSPSILAAKRKAEASLEPAVSKFARVDDSAIAPEPTPLSPTSPTTSNRPRAGDSFLLDLSYTQVEQGMEYLRVLCILKGKELSQAFKEVFPRAFYAASTFCRHRDLYFSTTPELLREWSEEHGERLWRQFHSLRTTTKDRYEGPNHWYATAEEKDAVRQRRQREHRLAADAQRELLARRRARPSETDGDVTIKEEDDDNSPIVKQEEDDDESLIIKQEVKEPIIKSEERGWSWITMDTDDDDNDDSDDDLDVECQLSRLDKGKGRAKSTASDWSPSESEDVAKQVAIRSTRKRTPDLPAKKSAPSKLVELIELSDTESETKPTKPTKRNKVEVIEILDSDSD